VIEGLQNYFYSNNICTIYSRTSCSYYYNFI